MPADGLRPFVGRCARWLLLTHDRARRDPFQLTYDLRKDACWRESRGLPSPLRRCSVQDQFRTLMDASPSLTVADSKKRLANVIASLPPTTNECFTNNHFHSNVKPSNNEAPDQMSLIRFARPLRSSCCCSWLYMLCKGVAKDRKTTSRAAPLKNWLTSMRETFHREVAFTLSTLVNARLQHFVKVTGLEVSAVVDHSLELFFESQPDASIIEDIRCLHSLSEEAW